MSVAERAVPDQSQLTSFDDQFSYRPIPVLVPISLGFIFLSFVGSMLAELLIVPAIGILVSLLAIRQIRSSRGNLSGVKLAYTAMSVQIAMLIGFAAFHAYTFATEVPKGYQRVNFTADISKKGFVVKDGQTEIHPDVQMLSNKKVMIKGYMYPTKEYRNLRSFVLCRDSGQCCFGGQPKTTDMIQVRIPGDRGVNFRQGLVSVAGEFLAEPTIDETGLHPVYQLNCEYFSPAKTWY